MDEVKEEPCRDTSDKYHDEDTHTSNNNKERSFILGLQLTSPPPCWKNLTKDLSMILLLYHRTWRICLLLSCSNGNDCKPRIPAIMSINPINQCCHLFFRFNYVGLYVVMIRKTIKTVLKVLILFMLGRDMQCAP